MACGLFFHYPPNGNSHPENKDSQFPTKLTFDLSEPNFIPAQKCHLVRSLLSQPYARTQEPEVPFPRHKADAYRDLPRSLRL